MASEYCPLCAGVMEPRSAAPCEKCGADSDSLARFNAGEESYYLVKILRSRELVLCAGCMVGFGELEPEFLAASQRSDYGFERMEIVRQVNGSVRNDYFCPECGYRLKFLRFVKDLRTRAGRGTDPAP